jgi:hypothetical protein
MTVDELKAIRDRADRGLDWDHDGAIGWAFNDRDTLLAEVDRLRADLKAAQSVVDSLAARVVAQSECLSRVAEKQAS